MKNAFVAADVRRRIPCHINVPFVFCLLCALSLRLAAPALANVYATDIRLNGGTTNLSVSLGSSVTIRYRLNEAATAGVTADILSGGTVIRSLTNASALKGTNTIVWDGTNSLGQAAAGNFSVAITARAVGYTNWTQLNADTNSEVFAPRGIAVNRNTNSTYYGRIFIANANGGGQPDVNVGDNVGILKYNADGTGAEEGILSTGGYDWSHGDDFNDYFSPWKTEVGPDDRVYINDFVFQGTILSFDQRISTNSLRMVLTTNNYPTPQSTLDGFCLSGSATNMQIWVADSRNRQTGNGSGIRRWNLTSGGIVASNDLGITVITNGPGNDIDGNPNDIAMDASGAIYITQTNITSGDRVFKFPAYTGSLESNAVWKIGTNDDTLDSACAVSPDPSGTYLAVALTGTYNGLDYDNGNTRILYASNGAPVITLSTNNNDHHDVAWDNAGNVYTCDSYDFAWRIYSPPGSNQAVTVAVPTIQMGSPAPILTSLTYSNGTVTFLLNGQPNVTYIIQRSSTLFDWTSIATNTSAAAVRQITVPAPPPHGMFRAMVAADVPTQPILTSPVISATQIQFQMIGQSFRTYVIESSTNLQTWIPVLTNFPGNATNTITLNKSGPWGFFRARVSQ
jgi:hypothetical protein